MDQTCRHWTCIGMGDLCVVGASNLSFPLACEAGARVMLFHRPHKAPALRMGYREPQMSYNSPLKNFSLIMYQFLTFPGTQFFWTHPGHESASLCIHF